jgi:hypothetical protein
MKLSYNEIFVDVPLFLYFGNSLFCFILFHKEE